MDVFRKHAAQPDALRYERAGLAWLAEAVPAGGAPVVRVHDHGPGWLETERLSEAAPQPALVDGVARLHGDLWGGNVLWARGDGLVAGTLIDPAAQGGHAESDLAQLAVFGVPHLDRVLAAYEEVSPPARGWRRRAGLHQMHILVVHAALFGGGYGAQCLRTAQPYL